VNWFENKDETLESWDSGGCAGLGNLYILAIVVPLLWLTMVIRDAIRVDLGFHFLSEKIALAIWHAA